MNLAVVLIAQDDVARLADCFERIIWQSLRPQLLVGVALPSSDATPWVLTEMIRAIGSVAIPGLSAQATFAASRADALTVGCSVAADADLIVVWPTRSPDRPNDLLAMINSFFDDHLHEVCIKKLDDSTIAFRRLVWERIGDEVRDGTPDEIFGLARKIGASCVLSDTLH